MVDFVLVEHDQLVVEVWSLILPGGEYGLLGNTESGVVIRLYCS